MRPFPVAFSTKIALVFIDLLWFCINKCVTEQQVSITSKHAENPFSTHVVTVDSVTFCTRFVEPSSQGRFK